MIEAQMADTPTITHTAVKRTLSTYTRCLDRASESLRDANRLRVITIVRKTRNIRTYVLFKNYERVFYNTLGTCTLVRPPRTPGYNGGK